jgi:hypothetical protein
MSEYRARQESWDCQQAVNAAAQPAWQQARCAEEQAAEAAAREELETFELRTRLNCLERRCEVQLQQLSDLQDRHHRLAGSVRLLEREVVRDRPEPPATEPPTVATDQELQHIWDSTIGLKEAFRALYDLGRQHSAQSHSPAVKESSAPPPAGSLVEMVARAIHPNVCADPNLYLHEARAAIREMVAWLRTGRLLNAAELLEHEADR